MGRRDGDSLLRRGYRKAAALFLTKTFAENRANVTGIKTVWWGQGYALTMLLHIVVENVRFF